MGLTVRFIETENDCARRYRGDGRVVRLIVMDLS
jgi:hypothetical protein